MGLIATPSDNFQTQKRSSRLSSRETIVLAEAQVTLGQALACWIGPAVEG